MFGSICVGVAYIVALRAAGWVDGKSFTVSENFLLTELE